LLELSDRPAGAALITGEAHRDQPLMHHIGADRTLAEVDHLLDVRQERIDQPRPARRLERVPAGIADLDIPSDRLGINTSELRGRPRALRRVERLQNLHDLPARLRQRPSDESW